jgi:hypothetical protein
MASAIYNPGDKMYFFGSSAPNVAYFPEHAKQMSHHI